MSHNPSPVSSQPAQPGPGQPIRVEARLESDGSVSPIALLWQGRMTPIADIGRQWAQEHDGIPYRHVLVMLPNSDRLELALNQASLAWFLVQTWTTPTFG